MDMVLKYTTANYGDGESIDGEDVLIIDTVEKIADTIAANHGLKVIDVVPDFDDDGGNFGGFGNYIVSFDNGDESLKITSVLFVGEKPN